MTIDLHTPTMPGRSASFFCPSRKTLVVCINREGKVFGESHEGVVGGGNAWAQHVRTGGGSSTETTQCIRARCFHAFYDRGAFPLKKGILNDGAS